MRLRPTTTPKMARVKAFAEDEGADLPGLRAEREADVDLLGPLSDDVDHDAVDADPGEQKGEDAEGGGEGSEKALLVKIGVNLLALSADLGERKVGVDAAENLAEVRREGVG